MSRKSLFSGEGPTWGLVHPLPVSYPSLREKGKWMMIISFMKSQRSVDTLYDIKRWCSLMILFRNAAIRVRDSVLRAFILYLRPHL